VRRAGLLVGLLLLSACGEPDVVQVEVTDLVPGAITKCQAFNEALPDTLADHARNEGESADDPVATYGMPPIVVACGVAEPEGFGPGVSCEIANKARWYIPEDQYGDEPREITITAAWSRPRVRVVIPEEYWPNASAAVMASLAPLVRKHLRSVGGRCL